MVECNLAKVDVEGSNPFSRSAPKGNRRKAGTERSSLRLTSSSGSLVGCPEAFFDCAGVAARLRSSRPCRAGPRAAETSTVRYGIEDAKGPLGGGREGARDLTVFMASDDAVTTIIESLKEHDELPRKQIAEIVEVVGSQVALELLAETRRVQDEGGVEVRDGTRRRTDGGVFFSLAKTKLPKADRNRIFRVRPPKSPDASAAEAAAEPPPPAKIPVVQQRRAQASDAVAPRDEPPAGLGRRRVVEVDVLRYQPKPILEKVPEVRAPAPSREPATRDHAGPAEMRPLRRIVTVAPTVKNELSGDAGCGA